MQNVQKDQDYVHVGELSLRLEEIVWGLDKSTRNLHFVLFFFQMYCTRLRSLSYVTLCLRGV